MSNVVRTITEKRLRAIMTHLLEKAGVSSDHAERCAAIYGTANLRGIDTHGIRLLPGNLKRILGGAVNPRATVRLLADAGALVVLDGDRGLGAVVGSIAMSRAIEVARKSGIGCVAARNSNHYGASGAFTMMAIDAGMIGISFSNCGQVMTIEGTVGRTVGNNPLAIGAPGPLFPVVLDMATSVASLGRIGVARREGKALPEEWIVQNSDQMRNMVLRHFGGAKGSGLAVMLEILTGVLSGEGMHRALNYNAREEPDRATHTQIAIAPDLILPRDRFLDAIGEMIRRLKAADRAPGVEEVRLPGERAWRETLKRRRDGIPLDEEVVKSLDDAARELGTTVPWGTGG